MRPGGGSFPGSNTFNSFFGGGGGGSSSNPPPPPYSGPKNSGPDVNTTASNGPGFWTGLGLGSLGGAALSRYFDGNTPRRQPPPTRYNPSYESYDWEREMRPQPRRSDDRGEGPSNLGTIRSSTGFGRTNVR